MSRSITGVLVLFLVLIQNSRQDVSHFFAQIPEFHYFQHQHPFAAQQSSQHIPVNFQSPYGQQPPPVAADTEGLYPNHVAPSEIATPAPVAAIPSSSEFLLPEIIENRSLKDRRNFIPLLKEYLPPTPPVADERPNYESPQQGNQQYDHFNGGYIYQKPTVTKPAPDSLEPNDTVILPPISKDPIDSSPINGYNYHAPSTPIIVAADEPSSTPSSAYLPAVRDQQFAVVQNSDNMVNLRLQVHEMRCLQHQTQTHAYFRAVLKIDNFLNAIPTVDNDSSDKRCQPKLHKSYVVVDIAGEDFKRCGVQQCGSDLCLRLRFPVIRGMRTVSDNILTLHCKSQSKVAIKTHALKVGVANDVQARNIGAYAKGGIQNSFRTHVELLSKTPQGYTRHLKSNQQVQLGEDLLLRAHVIAGDGWNYTKLTDVSLQRISPSGEMLNNIQLITSQGCLNPSMKAVCNQMPIFDAPLGHKLPFKAVMFQGMQSGEELIVSMRITGCLEYYDCYIDTEQCHHNFNTLNLKRRRRETINRNFANNTEISEISKISFRVIRPEEELNDNGDYILESITAKNKSLIIFGCLAFIGLFIFLAIFVLVKFRKY